MGVDSTSVTTRANPVPVAANGAEHTNGHTRKDEGPATMSSLAPRASVGTVRQAPSTWSGFHKKPLKDRQNHLRIIHPSLDHEHLLGGGLPGSVADLMVENCIGTIGLPLGLGLHCRVNNRKFEVPMAVEEPSIIAGVSSASKVIAANDGFTATYSGSVMKGQIQVLDVADVELACALVTDHQAQLVSKANQFCASMCKRGGGVMKVSAYPVLPKRHKEEGMKPMVIVTVDVNVCEAMGANIVNTIVEGLAPSVGTLVNGRVGVRILSNLSTERLAKSTFHVDVDCLAWHDVPGRDVAQRIIEAYWWADEDPHRAATHNKGIMNGIDAVAVAVGQDWRAIEAGAHAYASRSGHYGSMSSYRIEDTDGRTFLVGELELPMAVGVRGGALHTHPLYRHNLALMGNPDTKTLAEVVVSIGLAQNFAALRALAVDGIQKGHMALHARNIAIASGAPSKLAEEVAAYMISRSSINKGTAHEYLDAIRWHALRPSLSSGSLRHDETELTPSMLYVELKIGDSDSFGFNIAMDTLLTEPVQIIITPDSEPDGLHLLLFGDKGYEWMVTIFESLDNLRLHPKDAPSRTNLALVNKLKLASILANTLAQRLVASHYEATSLFVNQLLQPDVTKKDLFDVIPRDEGDAPLIGFPLLMALWHYFENEIEQFVLNEAVSAALRQEQITVLRSLVTRETAESVDEFLKLHRKRWQAGVLMLCDTLSLGPTLMTPERLGFLATLGDILECAGTVGHDVARYSRDQIANNPNVYNFWLKTRDQKPSAETCRDFIEEMDLKINTFRSELRDKFPSEFDIFNANDLLHKAMEDIRAYYDITSLVSLRPKWTGLN